MQARLLVLLPGLDGGVNVGGTVAWSGGTLTTTFVWPNSTPVGTVAFAGSLSSTYQVGNVYTSAPAGTIAFAGSSTGLLAVDIADPPRAKGVGVLQPAPA